MSSTVQVTATLPIDVVARLDERAAASERSRSQMIARILKQALADTEAALAESARRTVLLRSPPAYAEDSER